MEHVIGFLLASSQFFIGLLAGAALTVMAIIFLVRMVDMSENNRQEQPACTSQSKNTLHTPCYGPPRAENIAVALLDAENDCRSNGWHSTAEQIQQARQSLHQHKGPA
jgi:hypothetical protein